MKKILIVEDNLVVLSNISKLLKAEGFAVLTAENGRLGLKLAQTEHPDLILSDVMMPGKLLGTDLVELARFVRPSLPIILMSGYVDSSRGSPLDVLSKFPDVMLLQKPMRPDEILIAIKNSLAK